MTRFIRIVDTDDKANVLLGECRYMTHRSVDTRPGEFMSIPGSPFAYWVPGRVRLLFAAVDPLETESRVVRIGLTTHDDFRWLRLSWEAGYSPDLIPLAKGGHVRKFFSDLHLCVNWGAGGRLLKVSKIERLRRGELTANNSRCWNESHYGRRGITWPRRADGLSFRVLPKSSIFGDKGPAILAAGDDTDALLALTAILNSSTFETLMKLQVARVSLAQSYEVGLVRTTPLPPLPAEVGHDLRAAAHRGWTIARSADLSSETSHAFAVPALLQVEGPGFDLRVAAWAERVAAVEAELGRVQSEIDELCFDLYGISEEDRRAITEGFGVSDDDSDGGKDDEDDADETVELDPARLAAGLVSWAVGVGVGRFDVRLATGERDWPAEPDPFDPLPVCSPGMLTGEDGLPLVMPPAGCPVEVSPVLVDEPGHGLDITARVRAVFDVVFGADADKWWADVGTAMGARGGEVASWLSKGFFDHHLKTHSKSRRKAPILWPLGTVSGSYLVWLYAHRVTGDSLFRVLNDVVSPKLALERRRLTDLVQEAGPNPTAGQRKMIDAQDKLVDELEELARELNAVAPLWHPDLTDGVVIVLAPLWRLFAHHRAWSKELRKHWDKLQAGDYDWAQLAMRLWPERVVPECAEDRSLAIAHGLEDVFWVQDDNNPDKWHPRHTPTTPIDQLITERTNPTTKATLQGNRT